MSWRISFTSPARRDFGRLDHQVRERVLAALDRLAEMDLGDAKRLRSSRTELRLRVGDWRVRYAHDHSTQTINVLRILPRGRAYRD